MKANTEVIFFKSKVLKNGSSPLMLRITHSQKRKYLSLGVSLTPEFWDFKKKQTKTQLP